MVSSEEPSSGLGVRALPPPAETPIAALPDDPRVGQLERQMRAALRNEIRYENDISRLQGLLAQKEHSLLQHGERDVQRGRTHDELVRSLDERANELRIALVRSETNVDRVRDAEMALESRIEAKAQSEVSTARSTFRAQAQAHEQRVAENLHDTSRGWEIQAREICDTMDARVKFWEEGFRMSGSSESQ